MDVPKDFKTETLSVSVGKQHVCAINKKNRVKCWNYNKGVMKVPLEVKKEEYVEVSAGQ